MAGDSIEVVETEEHGWIIQVDGERICNALSKADGTHLAWQFAGAGDEVVVDGETKRTKEKEPWSPGHGPADQPPGMH